MLSERRDGDVLREFYFDLVMMDEFPEEFDPAVCGQDA
jgi:hypothetical protein